MVTSSSNKSLYGLAVAIGLAIGFYLYIRPVPLATTVNQLPLPPKTQAITLPWPALGQGAIGASGYGVLAIHNPGPPVPIGSTSKIITALAVLKQRPIQAGSQGPTITLSSSDVDLFNTYFSQGGSVTKVADGEQITELQALQSLLLPSSNNIADSLVNWAFGSMDAYLTYANRMVQAMGLKNTTVGDANGFSDSTKSTAQDMVKIGLAAINNPVIKMVISQTSAPIPIAGTVSNLNTLLGQDGVFGIKTGYTNLAGGCYIFAAQHTIQNHQISLVGAVLGQSTLSDAINSTPSLLNAADSGFVAITIVHRDQTLGYYKTKWGAVSSFKSVRDLSLFVWKGADIKITSQPDVIKAARAGTDVGQVTVASSGQSISSDLILSQNLPGPSPVWRLIR